LLFVESDPKYPIGEENFDIMGGGLRASVWYTMQPSFGRITNDCLGTWLHILC
jgi:hypothetical protein